MVDICDNGSLPGVAANLPAIAVHVHCFLPVYKMSDTRLLKVTCGSLVTSNSFYTSTASSLHYKLLVNL